MIKNTAGQKWIVFAFDTATGLPKTGDLLNITANLRLDGGAANPIDDTPIEILSSTAGAKAKLTGNFYHVYRGPSVTVATKKIQLTIGGGSAGTGMIADVTVLWRPVVAGGYYLNA